MWLGMMRDIHLYDRAICDRLVFTCVSLEQCLRKWGFRRCEDICWIKTNIKNPGHNKNLEPKAIFQRSKVSTAHTSFQLLQ